MDGQHELDGRHELGGQPEPGGLLSWSPALSPVAGYRLVSRLGGGSGGEVMRAQGPGGETAAIKFVGTPGGTPAIDPRRAFSRRIAVLARLRHPHLVPVRGAGRAADGTLAIVMDLVDGPDLRRLLARQGTFPPATAAALLAGILRGLGALHAAGLVHGDLRPENVLLEQVPGALVPRIADLDAFPAPSSLMRMPDGARDGASNSLPGHRAPESALDPRPTRAADMYAAGALLYELLSGFAPSAPVGMPASSPFGDAVPFTGRPCGVPDVLWRLVTALLAAQPRHRPADPQVIARWLDGLVPELSEWPAPPVQPAPPAFRPVLPSDGLPTPLVPAVAGRDRQPRRGRHPSSGRATRGIPG